MNPHQSFSSGNLKVKWLTKELPRLADRVCEIYDLNASLNSRKSAGTGFLVGPDLILTSFHVVEALMAGTQSEESSISTAKHQVEIVFHRVRDPSTLNKTVLCHLAEKDWKVISSPPGPDDEHPPGKRWDEPTLDQLDFALLRLDQKIGLEYIDADRAETMRGWFEIPDPFLENSPGRKILVLHNRFDDKDPLSLVTGEIIEHSANPENSRICYQVEADSIISGGSGSPCLDFDAGKLMGIHCGRVSTEKETRAVVKEYVPIGKIFSFIQNKDPGLANSLRYEPEKSSHKSSRFINEVPYERLTELLSQNEFLNILFTDLNEGENTIFQMQRFHYWVNVVIIGDLDGRLPLSDLRWKQICFNQHIKLLGVPNMPIKIQQLFENTVPLTNRDSISQIRFSVNYLSDITDAIFERLDQIQNSISDDEQKQYKKELIDDIEAAVQVSEALKMLIEKYKLNNEEGPNLKIKEKADKLYQVIYELPYTYLDDRSSDEMVSVGTSVHCFSKAIKKYCDWIDGLVRELEITMLHFSLN